MCFWREAEKVHFCLSNEHDAPVCGKFRLRERAEVFPNRGHFCGGESVEIFTSDTACGFALVRGKLRKHNNEQRCSRLGDTSAVEKM